MQNPEDKIFLSSVYQGEWVSGVMGRRKSKKETGKSNTDHYNTIQHHKTAKK
jgi:hypothetical protein